MKYLSMIALTLATCSGIGCAATRAADTRHLGAADVGQNQLVSEVARFDTDRPAGLAVSSTGRVFVTFPWLDRQPSVAVGELTTTGEVAAYPNAAWNHWDAKPGPSALRAIVCAQALTIVEEGGREYLWILDSGNPQQSGVITAGPKLFKIDLADDSVAQVFYFDHERDFAPNSILSDVRIDPAHGIAYISDAQRGGLYVVDLKQRQTRSLLIGHASTRPEPGVSLQAALTPHATAAKLGVAGIELSADRDYLYYHALAGRTLYRVPTALLRDPGVGPQQVADAVENLGTTGSAMDGLMLNAQTHDLYMAALEHNAIFVRKPSGEIETLVADERLRWPDSIALANDGYLYLTASARHLKRPKGQGSNEQPGYVLKVSLRFLERAAIAAQDAADAQQALEESQELARAAEQRVDDARKIAVAEAEITAGLLREVSRASEAVTTRQFQLAQAEQHVVDRLTQQQQAATQAKLDAEQADTQATVSAQAAIIAEQAAQIAELRANEAGQAAMLALELSQTADQSHAQTTAAETAYYSAIVTAQAARETALESRATASRMQKAAEAYQARAQVAADVWQAEAGYAQEFVAAAERAERFAEIASRSWQDAQLAEVHKAQDATLDEAAYELADVPTE